MLAVVSAGATKYHNSLLILVVSVSLRRKVKFVPLKVMEETVAPLGARIATPTTSNLLEPDPTVCENVSEEATEAVEEVGEP